MIKKTITAYILVVLFAVTAGATVFAEKAHAVETSVTVVSQEQLQAQLVQTLLMLIEQLQAQLAALEVKTETLEEEQKETRKRIDEREEQGDTNEAPTTPESIAEEYGFTIVERIELESGRTKLWLNTGQGVGLDLNAANWEDTLRATLNRIK